MRSGRRRRACRSRLRTVISPAPSAFGGRASSRTTWPPRRSSAASSTVTVRSDRSISFDRTLSSVVFPAPVPPATSRFIRSETDTRSSSAPSSVMPPTSTSASRSVTASEKRRTATIGPSTDAGGITAWSREPSGSRASTAGLARSIRSPRGAITRSTAAITARSSANATSVRSREPRRSIHTSDGPFTRTSVTSGSRSSRSIGPRPASASTASTIASGPASGATSGAIKEAAAVSGPRSRGTSDSSSRRTIRSVTPMIAPRLGATRGSIGPPDAEPGP